MNDNFFCVPHQIERTVLTERTVRTVRTVYKVRSLRAYWGVVHRCVGISEHAITTKLHQPLRYFHSFRNFYLLHHQQLLPCATSRKGADYVPADLGDSMVLKFRSHASGLFALSKDIRYPTVIEVREWDQICVIVDPHHIPYSCNI